MILVLEDNGFGPIYLEAGQILDCIYDTKVCLGWEDDGEAIMSINTTIVPEMLVDILILGSDSQLYSFILSHPYIYAKIICGVINNTIVNWLYSYFLTVAYKDNNIMWCDKHRHRGLFKISLECMLGVYIPVVIKYLIRVISTPQCHSTQHLQL